MAIKIVNAKVSINGKIFSQGEIVTEKINEKEEKRLIKEGFAVKTDEEVVIQDEDPMESGNSEESPNTGYPD